MEVLKITEELPETYPAVDGLSPAAEALDAAMIWQRIEGRVAYRWCPRAVTIILEGGGEWVPTLETMTVHGTFSWVGSDWVEVETNVTAIGYIVPDGRSKLETTVGLDRPPPAAALEAYRRLAEYVAAEVVGVPGASNYSIDMGQVSETIARSPAFMARALDYSGAADLLRGFRRV